MRHVNEYLRDCCVVAFMVVCATASQAELRGSEPDDNVIETFDVARHGDGLLVPVAIGDQQLQFLVDTGASWSVVDSALQPLLKPSSGFVQINRKSRHKRYRLDAASVGKSRLLLTGDAVCLDFVQIREASGYDIRGILGMSFLKPHVVHIDFDAGNLSILKRVPAAAGSEFRLSYDNMERPLLNVEIEDGETVAFVVDTGKIGGSLALRSYRIDELVENGRLELIGPPAVFVRAVRAEGGVFRRTGRLDKFRLGDFIHEGIKVNESEKNLIGLDLLSRYVVTFDFPNDRMYLKPGKRFAEPDQFGGCGMLITRIDGKTRIKAVREDGVADKVRLKVGDEILRVDGKDASSLALAEICTVLQTGGRLVRLDVDGPVGRREVEIRVPVPAAD